MKHFKESELILNKDGSIYHLKLRPEDLADTVVTVGDPNRVEQIAKHLDRRIFEKSNREFTACKGRLGAKEILIL